MTSILLGCIIILLTGIAAELLCIADILEKWKEMWKKSEEEKINRKCNCDGHS